MTMYSVPAAVASDEERDSSGDEDYLWVAARRQIRGGPPRTWTVPKPPPRSARSSSAPPAFTAAKVPLPPGLGTLAALSLNDMLATATIDHAFDDDDWIAQPPTGRLYRTASVGNSWGVTSIGRGFDWAQQDEDGASSPVEHNVRRPIPVPPVPSRDNTLKPRPHRVNSNVASKIAHSGTSPVISSSLTAIVTSASPVYGSFVSGPLSPSPASSRPASPRLVSGTNSPRPLSPSSNRPPLSRTPTSPRLNGPARPRRRSSQQRVSLIAGRVSIVPVEPPSPPPTAPQTLVRANSAASFLSVAASTRPPTPDSERDALNERSISEFVIEREIGRGAYGLVKRAREMNVDGTLGPPLVIKQIIKSRILADCWKRHPKYGTIPIEIYVMSAISSTQYVLPSRRPWDPSRNQPGPDDSWIEGKVVNGHPNICPLLDFFEDNHYYYLVLPSTTPEPKDGEPSPPSDLFDLVESYPHGLPPSSIRTYLGQIADAMAFLHSKGIVHRDIKDENVVLGPAGKCVLIDFGSSGLVKKNGWDTFSGTLDYAGPEILRGERYFGKEQDVWAFGVVAYVMLVGECPFTTAAEAQEGLESPFANAAIALDERCGDGKESEGEEPDGGGALGDAAALVRACLRVEVDARPTFQAILQSRFLNGRDGWGMDS